MPSELSPALSWALILLFVVGGMAIMLWARLDKVERKLKVLKIEHGLLADRHQRMREELLFAGVLSPSEDEDDGTQTPGLG